MLSEHLIQLPYTNGLARLVWVAVPDSWQLGAWKAPRPGSWAPQLGGRGPVSPVRLTSRWYSVCMLCPWPQTAGREPAGRP